MNDPTTNPAMDMMPPPLPPPMAAPPPAMDMMPPPMAGYYPPAMMMPPPLPPPMAPPLMMGMGMMPPMGGYYPPAMGMGMMPPMGGYYPPAMGMGMMPPMGGYYPPPAMDMMPPPLPPPMAAPPAAMAPPIPSSHYPMAAMDMMMPPPLPPPMAPPPPLTTREAAVQTFRGDVMQTAQSAMAAGVTGWGLAKEQYQSAMLVREQLFGTANYAPETDTFAQTALGAFGRRQARNMAQGEFELRAQQDLATRLGMGATGITASTIVPSVASLLGYAFGGPAALIAGIGATFLPSVLGYKPEVFQEHLQRRRIIQDLSRAFIRGPASDSPLGTGFTRQQAGELSRFVEEYKIGDRFFSDDDVDTILHGGMATGLFSAVRDTDGFKDKFKEVRDNLRLVMQTMNQTIEEGVQTMMELGRIGVTGDPNVKNFLLHTRAAAALSGLSPEAAAQTAFRGAEMLRGTGISMAWGANIGLHNLQALGTMSARKDLDLEAIRQLGGVEGAAHALTQTQLSMIQNDRTIQTQLIAASPHGSLDLNLLGQYMNPNISPYQTGAEAINITAREGLGGIYRRLARQDRIYEDLPEELVPLLAISSARKDAQNLINLGLAKGPADRDFVTGLLMERGISRPEARAMWDQAINAPENARNIFAQQLTEARMLLPNEREPFPWQRWGQDIRRFGHRYVDRPTIWFGEQAEDVGRDFVNYFTGNTVIPEELGRGLTQKSIEASLARTAAQGGMLDETLDNDLFAAPDLLDEETIDSIFDNPGLTLQRFRAGGHPSQSFARI